MRKIYLRVLKKFFYHQLIHTRASMKLTQAQMARLLAMDDRSYVELDHGNSGCSALTLALFLIYCCKDPAAFLKDLREAFEAEAERAA